MNTAAIYALIGALGGAFIGFLSTIIVTYITKRYEEKKHTKELIIKAAIDNWKVTQESIQKWATTSNKQIIMPPLDEYLIHMWQFYKIVLNTKITHQNIEEKLLEAKKISEKASEFYEKYNIIDRSKKQ